ncbi:MAG: nucleotide exchange factor GrpE [Nitrosopumilaceae archaeon]|nr:nucleotide exchange factor GrpE [Nitrosopumilaceae archaeon]NIU00250.1 nucleotide exchange factor GrpE [Nitrosopumilaceae archaeon]NIU86662.1 nucleotide exchange factor GrpE [Nitrosopumilaceae archaeon]NIV65357.1 nucleotide exchange factor GrpE [Nitrosopumilaceae archaeon]NIX60852.1 nucleotide exchange factor GrpE [Nitrosopumilaceae archaeon]
MPKDNEANVEEDEESQESFQEESDETSKLELKKLLDEEKLKVSNYEDKLRRVLADYQNLQRKTQSDIQNGINKKIDEFFCDFLQIYDDFVRARNAYSESNIDTKGVDSIIKNMDSLMKKYNIVPIDAVGEIFDPNYHEAISVVEEADLDDNTITKEIRKGYISQNRVIRPSLVEISKKPKSEGN